MTSIGLFGQTFEMVAVANEIRKNYIVNLYLYVMNFQFFENKLWASSNVYCNNKKCSPRDLYEMILQGSAADAAGFNFRRRRQNCLCKIMQIME